jgi:two-component system sensor histidine kinase/response regulator
MPADAAPDPALDPAVIVELRRAQDACGNPAFIAQLVALFQANAPTRLASIREAVAFCDGAALGHTSHTLKSNCAMLGATRLAEICARLEACGDSGAFDGTVLLLDKASAELERVLKELAALVANQKSEDRSQSEEPGSPNSVF